MWSILESAFSFIIPGGITVKKVAICILIFGLQIKAADSTAVVVEKDLNSYVKSTLPGEDSSVEVLRQADDPQVKCSNVIFNKGRKIVFCTADFQTSFGENKENHKTVNCTSLGYILGPKGEIESPYNPDNFAKCIEKISDACYE